MALLVTAAWVLLFAAQSLPRGDLDRAASPGEWKAWIGVVFMAVAVAYFLAKIRVFQGAGVPFNPEATAVGRNPVLLLVAWAVLSSVVASRWKGQRSEEHTSELQSLMRTSYAVFCLKKNNTYKTT